MNTSSHSYVDKVGSLMISIGSIIRNIEVTNSSFKPFVKKGMLINLSCSQTSIYVNKIQVICDKIVQSRCIYQVFARLNFYSP